MEHVIIILACVNLGSPDYPRREQAHAALGALLPASLPYLEALEHHPDPEVSTRAGQLVRGWRGQAARQEVRLLLAHHRAEELTLDKLPPGHEGAYYQYHGAGWRRTVEGWWYMDCRYSLRLYLADLWEAGREADAEMLVYLMKGRR